MLILRNSNECTHFTNSLALQYLLEMAYRHYDVSHVVSDIIRYLDYFSQKEEGPNPIVEHVPYSGKINKQNVIIGAYCIMYLKNNRRRFKSYKGTSIYRAMSNTALERVGRYSANPNDIDLMHAWKYYYPEMLKETVITETCCKQLGLIDTYLEFQKKLGIC